MGYVYFQLIKPTHHIGTSLLDKYNKDNMEVGNDTWIARSWAYESVIMYITKRGGQILTGNVLHVEGGAAAGEIALVAAARLQARVQYLGQRRLTLNNY